MPAAATLPSGVPRSRVGGTPASGILGQAHRRVSVHLRTRAAKPGSCRAPGTCPQGLPCPPYAYPSCEPGEGTALRTLRLP